MTPPWLAELVAAALREDLGPRGEDLTSLATVPAEATATARLVTRAAGVVAGLDAAGAVFDALGATLSARVADGERADAGATLATVTGSTRALLAGERTALNLLTHLSGVATLTARYVEAVGGTACVMRDTRKTIPGLRLLEKAAVRAGGGINHRAGLHDGILVKDNHVAAAGSVGAAARAALEAGARHGVPVQVEVDDLEGLGEALAAGVTAVLCDNFSLDALREAVRRCRERDVFVEASGGITLDTVRAVAETGVDAVAVGALTHSAPALDIGLDF